MRYFFLESHGLTDADPRPAPRRAGARPLPGRRRLLRPRHGVVAPGLERGVGLPRRLRLPRVLPRHRLGAAARLPGRRPARRASARTSASSTTASRGRSRWARSSPTSRSGRGTRRPSHAGNFLQPRRSRSGTAAGGMDRPPDRGQPLRRGAVRPLVVRGADVPRLPLPQDALRPGRREADHAAASSSSVHPSCEVAQPPMCTWGAKGFAEVWLNPANDWIYPHLRDGGGAHGRAGAPVTRTPDDLRAAGARTRPPASCCWPRPRTGPSS